VDRARRLIRIPPCWPRTARCFPATPNCGEGCFPCPRPIPRSCNNSTASTGLYLGFTINSATYFMERSMSSVCGTSKAMIWCGWLTIWIGCVLASPSSILRLSQRRFSMISILPVPRPGNVYVNSGVYAAPRGYSQHRTRFHVTSSPLTPTPLPREVTAMCMREPSMVQRFVLNVCGFILKMVQKRLPRRVSGAIAFLFCHANGTYRSFAKRP
jgi:hypothetical protein